MGSLLKLRPYLKPYYGLLALSLVLAIPLALLRMAPAPFVKQVVDDLLVNKDTSKLALFPIFFIGLFVLNFIVRFFHYYFVRIVVTRVNQKLKTDLYDHIVGLSADYFTTQSTGTLISRVGSDTQYIDGGIQAINTLVREPITFLALLGYAFYLDSKLTLIAILVIPPLVWVFTATGRNLKRYIGRLAGENATLFTVLQESFSGIRVVQAFCLETYVGRRFKEQAQKFSKTLLKSAVLEEASHPMVELLTAFAVAGVVYYGGAQVVQGQMSAGDLLSFCTAFALIMNPLRLLNDANIKLHSAAAAAERIFETFSLSSRLIEQKNPIPLKPLQSELKFEGVRFAYPDYLEREVLKGVNFTIPKGQITALVGVSGSGKSSLVNLIPRVFDVSQGRILIDGTDIRFFKLAHLRQMIAIVSQDVFLFNDTVTENIRCGRLHATTEEVKEAARQANALEFIEKLPEGFNTVIGERGQKLSGGERQRLSIARAFLRQAPILILDEATSNLDNQSERIVQRAIDQLMLNRTTLLIAHRLSTVRHADQILVLKNGEIIERGTHEELLQLNGEYFRLDQAVSYCR